MEGFQQIVDQWVHERRTGIGGVVTGKCREDCHRCQVQRHLSKVKKTIWEVRDAYTNPSNEMAFALGKVYEALFGVPMVDERKGRGRSGRRQKPS
jgi:hypothetical protein